MKKLIATLAVITILTNAATAQTSIVTGNAFTNEPLSVKYIGTEDNYLVFEITVNMNGTERTVLNIDDKNTGQLYSEMLKGHIDIQTIKIEKRQDQALSFELVTGKVTYYKNFDVNTRTIEKTTVQESGIAIR